MHVTQIISFPFSDVQVRTLTIEGEMWFVAKDVCAILGIRHQRDIVSSMLDDEDRMITTIFSSGQRRQFMLINEAGFFVLIMRSSKPKAKSLRKLLSKKMSLVFKENGNFTVVNSSLEMVMQPDSVSLIPNAEPVGVKKTWIKVALQTLGATMRKLLRLLKSIVFTTQTQDGQL